MNNKKLVNDPTIKFKGPFSGILFSIFSLFLFLFLVLSVTILFLFIKIQINVIPFSSKLQTHES